MSNVFFISDLHFGHRAIVEFGRITGTVYRTGDNYLENMHHIITQWNSVVTKRCRVFVLGDTAFTEEGFEALKELKGDKILVRGNHDDNFSTKQWLEVFNDVLGLHKYKEFWLSHAPIHSMELRGKRNIHGHVHFNSIRNMHGDFDKRYINVCCEAIGETPVSLSQIRTGEYDKRRKC